jgi:type I restriction enzyme S subunit
MSKANDVIIPSSGETKEDIATASCVLHDNVALGGDINVIRTSNNGVFLSYYLNNAKKHDIAKIAQGISIIHLYNEQLRNLSIELPNLEEQQKIAECLSSIDSYISSIIQKVEQLKAHKKSFIQKLFPQGDKTVPEYRFPEFKKDCAWEKREFKEIIKVNSGRDYKHLSSGNIPVYGTGGYMLSVNGKLSDKDAVGIGRKGTIDRPQYLKAPFWTVDTLFFLTNCDGYDIEFIYYLSQIIQWKKYGEQTGVPSLSKNSIERLEVVVPTNIEEQKRIACALSSLDEEITLLEKKVSLLESHKNGLMQQLFPQI